MNRWQHILFWLSTFFGTEWTENPNAWPHCCTQAGCWMHVDEPSCRCKCFWCLIAASFFDLPDETDFEDGVQEGYRES